MLSQWTLRQLMGEIRVSQFILVAFIVISFIGWIINQVIEVLLRSPNIDEVFDDDLGLRKKIHDAFKRNIVDEDQLDAEVRARIKNVREGTADWDIEYQKVMREVKRKHGLIRSE